MKIYFKNWEQTEVFVLVTACESDCTPAFPTRCRWSHGVCTRGYSRITIQGLRNTSMHLFLCRSRFGNVSCFNHIFEDFFFQWNVFYLLTHCWQRPLFLCSAISWFLQKEKALQKWAVTNSSVMEWQVWELFPFGLSSTEHGSHSQAFAIFYSYFAV